MQPITPRIDLDIELSPEGNFHIISSSVDCQDKEGDSISELILKAISASERATN